MEETSFHHVKLKQAEEEVGLDRRIVDSVQEGSPEYSSGYNSVTDHEKTDQIHKPQFLVSHSIPVVPDPA